MYTKIAVADNHTIYRKGIIALLNKYNVEVVIEARSTTDLIQQLSTKCPDVILINPRSNAWQEVEVVKQIKGKFPQTKVLILTQQNHERNILYSLEMGVNGFLLKDAKAEELPVAIEQVITKGCYYDDQVVQMMHKRVTQRQKRSLIEGLTQRELEVLQLTCEGLTASEIGEQLFITKRTVEGHRRNILEKIGGKNMTNMIVYAIQHNLVELD